MRAVPRYEVAFFLAITLGALAAPVGAQSPYSIPPQDSPELAALGSHTVGVRTLRLVNPRQPDIARIVQSGDIGAHADRKLTVEVWYPAIKPPTGASTAVYTAKLPRASSGVSRPDFSHAGIAYRDAAPQVGSRFPLVLVSHGFGGWGTFMTYLTENLTSKGYVVAAIDHADLPFTDAGGFALSFGATMILRARDQSFVLSHLESLTKDESDPLGKLIDAKSIAVIGYSMGGFGALATAGAGYDPASPSFRQIPPPLMAPLAEGNAEFVASRNKNIKAVVLIAPWGGQPANKAWTPKGLQAIRSPTMFISGDQDDIVDYAQGVRALFDALGAADRHLLVYQNARHNTGGNPAPAEATHDFTAREYFDEPVWRKDRIGAINQHFISAFLDRHLKGIAAREAYFNVPTVKGNEAKWPTAFGQNTGGTPATGEGDTTGYWKGFQRRWAIGLEMHRKKAGE